MWLRRKWSWYERSSRRSHQHVSGSMCYCIFKETMKMLTKCCWGKDGVFHCSCTYKNFIVQWIVNLWMSFLLSSEDQFKVANTVVSVEWDFCAGKLAPTKISILFQRKTLSTKKLIWDIRRFVAVQIDNFIYLFLSHSYDFQ